MHHRGQQQDDRHRRQRLPRLGEQREVNRRHVQQRRGEQAARRPTCPAPDERDEAEERRQTHERLQAQQKRITAGGSWLMSV